MEKVKVKFLKATSAYAYFAGDIGYVNAGDLDMLIENGIIELVEEEKSKAGNEEIEVLAKKIKQDWVKYAQLAATVILIGLTVTILIML